MHKIWKKFPVLNPWAAANPPINIMIAEKTLYLNEDKTKIVGEDSEDAAFLLVREGGEVTLEMAEKYKLKGSKSTETSTGKDSAELKKAQTDLKKAQSDLDDANKEIEKLKKELAEAKKANKPAETKPTGPAENK